MAAADETCWPGWPFDAGRGRCSDCRECGTPHVDSCSQTTGFTRDEVEDEARLSEQKASYRKHSKVKVKKLLIRFSSTLFAVTKCPVPRRPSSTNETKAASVNRGGVSSCACSHTGSITHSSLLTLICSSSGEHSCLKRARRVTASR